MLPGCYSCVVLEPSAALLHERVLRDIIYVIIIVYS
jgi:hypothetical protein